MTPQEKAKELVEKFELAIKHGEKYGWNNEAQRLIMISAKECATIYVNDIMESNYGEGYDHKFWQSVKQEIEKL